MPILHLLGTGAALSDAHRTTTMLAVNDQDFTLVIDCGGDVIQRLMMTGVSVDTIEALVVTHEHPDHAGGFPLFMEKLWLAGRRRPLDVYGPASGIGQAQRSFATFDTSRWEGLPEVVEHEVALEEYTTVFDNDVFRVVASPGDHGVPVIGLRVESKSTGGVLAYSCDTRPSDTIARLGQGADLFVHEATGSGPVHSSIEEAAEIARTAEANHLVLVHLPPGLADADLDEGRSIFSSIALGEELGTYSF